MMASRSGSVATRPNGTGSSPARMRSISPSQNGPISATWASTSGGPQRASSEASKTSASGHGSPASTAGRVAAKAAAAAAKSGEQVVIHARQCGTPGVALEASSPVGTGLRRPRRPARSRGDPR